MDNIYQGPFSEFSPYDSILVENREETVSSNINNNESGNITLTDLSFSNFNNSLNKNEILCLLQEWGMPYVFDTLTSKPLFSVSCTFFAKFYFRKILKLLLLCVDI